METVKKDLKQIHAYLLRPNCYVLGWQNRDSGNGYAIGGGIVGRFASTAEGREVQAELKKFAGDYPATAEIVQLLNSEEKAKKEYKA